MFDNAIEAAVLSDVPKISVANFYQDDNFVFMIENSTKEESTQPESTPQADQSTEAPLPQTGPTSDILTALVLGVTAAASLAYFRSQRII